MSEAIALIIDDEPDIRELLEITLGRMGVNTKGASTVKEAYECLANHTFDVCLTDMRLPDGDGLDIVDHIQAQYPNLPVAVITAHGSMETAVSALKKGAFDFVSKPIDLNILRNLINTALKLTNKLKSSEAATTTHPLTGETEQMHHLMKMIEKVARSQAPVYISGESGSGKELVARRIHDLGPRYDKPFVPVNCGAIPTELMESEFFGHKKGSFTGAHEDKLGLFQAADGGTLFLDEVADLPLSMQVKLLRAIQEKAVRPVGSQSEVLIDVRILSATHQDLHTLVQDGEFRQDLFYRINVIELHVPSLRERKADILLLANEILVSLCNDLDMNQISLSNEAQKALEAYDFPGNVRELENILERALTLCDNKSIHAEDLQLPNVSSQTRANTVEQPATASQEESPLDDEVSLESYLDNVEKDAIVKALEETRWNKTAAAKKLGISFRALRYRLKKLGLD